MDPLTLVLFLIGLVLLTAGADVLVKGAASLAAGLGISPLIIGLTVVAFGTSAPELSVSVSSAWSGQADIALGNVVGSNICNVLLILGLAALAAPLVVQPQLVRFDVPVMIACGVLLLLVSLDGVISRLDGLLLSAGLVAYVLALLFKSRNDKALADSMRDEAGLDAGAGARPLRNLVLVVAGLAMLVVGAGWLVDGAVMLARGLGVSELVIGLTIVAVGTSLPELATSVMASIRGQRDIAIGNVVGSNIFNILCVLGLSSLVSPAGIRVAPEALAFDIPVMLAVSVFCLPLFWLGYRISRLRGALLLAAYAAYVSLLIG